MAIASLVLASLVPANSSGVSVGSRRWSCSSEVMRCLSCQCQSFQSRSETSAQNPLPALSKRLSLPTIAAAGDAIIELDGTDPNGTYRLWSTSPGWDSNRPALTPRGDGKAVDIKVLDVPHPTMNVPPGYFAMFENNDPSGRMIALANWNNDLGDYWEWSAEGLYGSDPTNEAYRLGVNYIVYAMTH